MTRAARRETGGWMAAVCVLGGAMAMGGCAAGGGGGGTRVGSGEAARGEAHRTLDAFHDAASRADEARYFDLIDEGGVFLGTDATERWTKEAFRAYAHPHFAQGRGWTYTAVTRNVALADDGTTAWFDEDLRNEKLGQCRGTGVLVRRGGAWRIAQYNLTVPVPNAMVEDLAARIRGK